MILQPIEHSSNIEAIGYDALEQLLAIRFTSGSTYEYEGVPAEVYNALMGAHSKGSFFYQNIRGQYATRKVA